MPTRRIFVGGAAGALTAGTVAGGASPATAAPATAAPHAADPDIWQTVLDDADLVWRRMPATWYEGPFLGNALLGCGVYGEPGTNAVRFTVQHSEVQDHRPEFGSLFGLARLPVGHFTLEPVGNITAVDWRLRLHDAELTGTVTTDAGTLTLRALVHNSASVLAVEVVPSAAETGYRWVFHPAEAVSPRTAFRDPPPGYTGNPPPVVGDHDGTSAAVQELHAGGQHVTAWQERTGSEAAGARTLYAAVAHSHPADTALKSALKSVRAAAPRSYDEHAATHRPWWHGYYRKSFLSVPDARLQRFYWIQLYKAASAARRDAPVMATCGPWLEPTPWPATWWNLNVQLEYWLIHGSNHLELDAVTRALSEYRDALSTGLAKPYRTDSAGIARTTDIRLRHGDGVTNSNFPVGVPGQEDPPPEVGNLTWALHNVWLSYRHTMDTAILRDVLYPLLRKAINYYLHFLAPGDDGRLHLPRTYSPEYGGNTTDCNYDLMLIRWGCRTLLDSAELLGLRDELVPRWQQVLRTLTPYPVDENGFMIGAEIPFAKSHRHYSHLLAIYPLYEINWWRTDQRELIETSLNHWLSFDGALQGYTFTGAASIAAQMARGDQALGYLGELLSRYIQPNTMYRESGPVIETPLSAAQSMHDMLCQSWGDVIRVFPAVPSSWRSIALHDFRTQGAFLLSASRQDGATRWVRLRSEAGAPCVVQHSLEGAVEVRDEAGSPVPFEDLGGGTLRIQLGKGGQAIVTKEGDRPDMTVRPVAPNEPAPPWGLPDQLPDQ